MSANRISKEMIIEFSENTRVDNLTRGWDGSYNLRYPIGQYTLSIAVGEGMYCSPRRVLEDVADYTAVELAILKPFDKGLMSLSEVERSFGHEVAKYCEGYDAENGMHDEDAFLGSTTVMPWITWENVESVAGCLRRYVMRRGLEKPSEICHTFYPDPHGSNAVDYLGRHFPK